MKRRLAPGVGVALTGIVFAATLRPWPDSGTLATETPVAGGSASLSPVGTALTLVALGAFLAVRRGVLDRVEGNAVSGVASGAVALYGVVVVVGAVQAGAAAGPWPVAALVAGTAAALTALVDAFGLQSEDVLVRVQSTVAAGIVGVLGLVGITLWHVVLLSVAAGVAESPSAAAEVLLGTIATALGTITVALGYLNGSDRGLSFVDLRWPDTRDIVYCVGGLVVLLVTLFVGAELIELLGLPSSEHSIVQTAREDDPDVLLWLIPLSVLLVGPGEELLYRNVIQKSLYDPFSRTGAVVVTSVLFASIHFSAYATAGLLETIGSLVLIVPLSIILGVAFARTENVLVPALIHGAFNAFQYAALYVAVTRGVEVV